MRHARHCVFSLAPVLGAQSIHREGSEDRAWVR